MFARILDPVWPATGTALWCSCVRPHWPQNTCAAGATARAAPASATQRHATIFFLGSILIFPSSILQGPSGAGGAPRERPDARPPADRPARDVRPLRALHVAPGLVRQAHGPSLPTHLAAPLPRGRRLPDAAAPRARRRPPARRP